MNYAVQNNKSQQILKETLIKLNETTENWSGPQQNKPINMHILSL